MKESLEELKAIIENKPEGAGFYDSGNVEYIKFNGRIPMFHDARGWHMFKWPCKLRSIPDIEEIIELRELLKDITNNEDLDDCRFIAVDRALNG